MTVPTVTGTGTFRNVPLRGAGGTDGAFTDPIRSLRTLMFPQWSLAVSLAVRRDWGFGKLCFYEISRQTGVVLSVMYHSAV